MYYCIYIWIRYVYGLYENMNIWMDNVGADQPQASQLRWADRRRFLQRAGHSLPREAASQTSLTHGGSGWVDLKIPEVWPETQQITLWLCQNSYWKWPLKWWVFPLKMVIFHSFLYVYQRVKPHEVGLERSCGRSFQASHDRLLEVLKVWLKEVVLFMGFPSGLRKADFKGFIINVNPGLINPVYGCFSLGGIPSKSIRWIMTIWGVPP